MYKGIYIFQTVNTENKYQLLVYYNICILDMTNDVKAYSHNVTVRQPFRPTCHFWFRRHTAHLLQVLSRIRICIFHLSYPLDPSRTLTKLIFNI